MITENHSARGICAYSLGIHAALRIESYEGITEVPANPFPPGHRYRQWEDGFADGTDDLINSQIDAEF